MLCECPLQEIEGALKELPETLDDTYQRILRNIDKKKQEYAHRIFQCLAVSIRPLRIEELAEIFAIKANVETTGILEFNARWRYKNAQDAIRSACSTLITIVDLDGSKVVQFSHFSVKEYLMSPRLAISNIVSHYYIRLQAAHTFLARACLCVLLQLDDVIDNNRIKEFPLATYAAEHWVGHAQFENVSSFLRDEMGGLFDRDKPHFVAWIRAYDVDRLGSHMLSIRPKKHKAPPLYYTALCGFRDMAQQLVSTHPQDVYARGGNRTTPLHAAVDKGHLEVALFLLDHGVDVNARDDRDATPLHLASRHGDAMVVRSLIDRGADPNAEDKGKVTPLLEASQHGRLEAARLLLEHGADMNHWDASAWSPLERASAWGNYDIAQLLLVHGANASEQGTDGWSPLHLASAWGHAEVARLMLDRGAGMNAQNADLQTPLHEAAFYGRLQAAKVLLEHGADLHIQNKKGKTPFQVASERGYDELAQLLSEGAGDGA
jgi:ankyrin repeat protein